MLIGHSPMPASRRGRLIGCAWLSNKLNGCSVRTSAECPDVAARRGGRGPSRAAGVSVVTACLLIARFLRTNPSLYHRLHLQERSPSAPSRSALIVIQVLPGLHLSNLKLIMGGDSRISRGKIASGLLLPPRPKRRKVLGSQDRQEVTNFFLGSVLLFCKLYLQYSTF